MDNHLTFEHQIVKLKQNCFRTLRNICKIRFLLSRSQLKTIVNSLVVSCLNYCNGLYFGIAERLLNQLQLIQNAAAKAVTGKYKYDHLGDLNDLHWLQIKKRVVFKISLIAYKSINGLAPEYLQDMFQYSHHGHSLKLIVPQYTSSFGRRSFSYAGPKIFNNLPHTSRRQILLICLRVILRLIYLLCRTQNLKYLYTYNKLCYPFLSN